MSLHRLAILAILCTALVLGACSSDDGTPTPPPVDETITVSNFIPTAGPAGTVLLIKGSNFGTDASKFVVTFGTLIVPVDSLSNTEAKVTVPGTILLGPTLIKVQRGSGQAKTLQFTVQDPIVRAWVAEGLNVAPALYAPPQLLRKLTLQCFSASNAYTLTQVDSSGRSTIFTGEWNAAYGAGDNNSISLRTVTLTQATPSTMDAQGIYQVTIVNSKDISMKLEVVPTNPAVGLTPPTAQGGFGSTGGAPAGDYVSTFVKK